MSQQSPFISRRLPTANKNQPQLSRVGNVSLSELRFSAWIRQQSLFYRAVSAFARKPDNKRDGGALGQAQRPHAETEQMCNSPGHRYDGSGSGSDSAVQYVPHTCSYGNVVNLSD